MTGSEPGEAHPGAGTGEPDALAARLLAVHRAIAGLSPDSQARFRLHLRFMAICTSLKVPGVSQERGAQQLERLMADVARARKVQGLPG